MENQVKSLLLIIKIFPAFTVLLMSFIIIVVLINEEKIEIQEQKNNIEKQFMFSEKKRIKSNIDIIYTYAKLLQSTSEKELQKDLKYRINNIHNLMLNIYIKNKDKKSKAEIIKQIKDAVDPLRFDNGNGYFSIHTIEGINILHPIIKKYEGTSVLNRKDAKGSYSVQKAINIAKTKGEGFFNWYSLKPNIDSREFEKIGIVKSFEPYDLIITTGTFKDSFQNSLKKKMLNYISNLKYKNDAYPFVINFKGDILYHPSKKVLNANIFDEKRFSHISNMFKKLITERGDDIEDYLYIKPKVLENKETKETKITYSKRIDDWQWIILTSFKLSNANNFIRNMKNIEEERYSKYKKEVIFYGLIAIFFFLFFSYFVTKLLEKKFLKYKKDSETQNEKLITLKAQLDNAINIAHLGIWEWDAIKNITIWSDINYEIYGIKKGTPLNIEFIESLVLEEDLDFHRKVVGKCLEDKKAVTFEYRIKKDNEIRILLVICDTIVENDTVVKLFGVVQDITEIRKQENDLLNAQKISKIGHYDFDIEKNVFTSSFVLDDIWGINKEFKRSFDTWLELVFEDDKEMMLNYFKTIVANKTDFDKEYRVINQKTKEIKWVHGLGVMIFDDKNIPLRMFGTIQDITKIKELELDKIQKDKLLSQQSKMAAMGEMLGNIAHQWRQPLSTISTASTGAKLQKEMDILSDEQLIESLTMINDSAQYLSQTIEDFRGFFNPNNNKINEFDILDTFNKTLKLLNAQLISKDIEIIQDIKSLKLSSIENELIQVLINVINNARDALLINQEEKRLVFISTYRKNKTIYIEILDNAKGIKEDIIDRIFEPYFTTKYKSQGTGIGLYMSQDIVKNHLNGEISVCNKNFTYKDIDCVGAKFTIEMPIS
ncbi:hypothetical protein LPB137_03710 [Poseidonibacter parvus]|uniref:histidine kinase n=1 Tax=Poseidonibacter parvus TaxID=1850254 RepID=A0A1P8KKB2_9BACT|nr:cache domain-containing protein [Poseidonibacter parvus]APW65003.1 hypothetical protein LPB137_03710 [Poseidonibacter parvus]